MAHLSLGVLGPLQVLLDGMPVAMLKSDKVRALLTYLAVEADRAHRRESLAGLFWPECPEPVARHNLRQALSDLRRAIGDQSANPPYLLISRDAIQFNRVADSTLDLAQFNAILRACEQDWRGGEDGSLRTARLEEMVALYRGEFLHGFFLDGSAEFEEWILVRREGLHRRVLEAHGWLAGYYEEHGDLPAARRHALRQLELDPWREEAYCQLMRALALDGQRAAALAQYDTCRRVLADELGVEPSANTRQLAEQIRAGTLTAKPELPSPAASAPLHNLPASLTSFHGREQELADLGRLLAGPECRCISLVGPGGIGKTRLALQAAEQHRAAFPHGVAFVPLASVGSVEAAVGATAGAVRLSFYDPSDPREQLLNHLSEKRMLLVLDNVEQLLVEDPHQAGFAELVLEMLERAPGVKLLVTSREVLDLQEEWVLEVGGLALPGPEQREGLDGYAAVALFMQRARRASPGFTCPEADLAAIARVCRLVEGTPLAVELAATWSRILSPAEIGREIEGGLDFLSASVRDLPERHRSMRVVFDQTWQRLSAKEQQVLSHLSVFRGGFSRQAAEQVAGASLPVLSTLVNRTLVRRNAAGRYQLHELVRQYGATHLAADPQAQAAAQKRHFECFLALAEAAEQGLAGRDQMEWLRQLEEEQDNLRAALEWALESDWATPRGEELSLRLSGALRWFWRAHGHFREGHSWLEKALQQQPEGRTAARAAALLGKSAMTYGLGDLEATCRSAEQSAAIYRELGDPRGLAESLASIGLTFGWQGEASLGRARLEEALANYRQVGDRWGEARVLNWFGSYLGEYSGDPAGWAMLEESAAILEDLGEKYVLSGVVTSLGVVHVRLGEYAAARAEFERGLALARETKHSLAVVTALTNLGSVCRILGQYSAGRSHLEGALQVCQEHGCSIWETDVRCALAENTLSQGDLTSARLHPQAATHLLEISGNSLLHMRACYFRGLLAFYEGDAAAARMLLEETVALAREGRYRPDLARSLVALGRAKRTLGELSPASELPREGLEVFRALGDRPGIASALEELGAVSAVQGDGVQAAVLFGTAHALREGMGAPLPPVDRAAHDSVVAACRAQLGETAFAEAWAHGAARPFQEVVEQVLKRCPYTR